MHDATFVKAAWLNNASTHRSLPVFKREEITGIFNVARHLLYAYLQLQMAHYLCEKYG